MRRPSVRGSGFTLVEMLLVLVIMGIAVAVTIPNLVGSIRGHRLRGAARTIVMAGRYAHSMAIMKQTDMALKMDLDNAVVSVSAAESAPRPLNEDTSPPGLGVPGSMDDAPEGPEVPVVRSVGAVELSRKLDQVMIKSVELEAVDNDEEDSFSTGSATIFYRSNGTCTPYVVLLADEHGSRIKLTVDALSTAKTETLE